MLMNHKPAARTVYVQYTVHYASGQTLTPVRPYWFDEHNCSADPIFDVPGNGRLFSTFSKSVDYTMPESGRMVAILGHLHGGGVRLDLDRPHLQHEALHLRADLGTPGRPPDHPRARAEAHDDADLANGIPVSAGDRLRLTAVYDNSLPHTRVMGVMVAYLAPGPVSKCEAGPPLPGGSA